MTPALRAACARAAHVLTADGDLLRAGRAMTFVLARTGFARTARLMSVVPITSLVELGYWSVARTRHWVGQPLLRDLQDEVEPTRAEGRRKMHAWAEQAL